MDEERGGRRGGGGGGYDRGPRTMYDAVCSDCGQATQVPFKPDPATAEIVSQSAGRDGSEIDNGTAFEPFSFELHPVMRLARSSFFYPRTPANAPAGGARLGRGSSLIASRRLRR